jgi:hypothetical protein
VKVNNKNAFQEEKLFTQLSDILNCGKFFVDLDMLNIFAITKCEVAKAKF